ncbi:uncharacterized protein LOC142241741 isoform X2 [Haematobia irritans]
MPLPPIDKIKPFQVKVANIKPQLIDSTTKDPLQSLVLKLAKIKTKSGRPIASKIMVEKALQSTRNGNEEDSERKYITLQGIQKFIALHYFLTSDEIKKRMPYIKRFLHQLLESKKIFRKNGVGLIGSFYVPSSFKERTNKRSTPKTRRVQKVARKTQRQNAKK